MEEIVAICLPGVLVMLGLVIASGFFSGSETALFYLSSKDRGELAGGSAGDRLALNLLERPDRLLTTILFWNLVINLTYFTVGILTAKQLIDAGHEFIAGSLNLAALIGIIVFGEVIPKSLAVVAGRRLIGTIAMPLAASARLIDPILPTLATVASAIRRVRHPVIEPEPMLQPRDLDRAAELTETDGRLTVDDARIFRNILDLVDLTAEDLMWPRARFETLGRSIVDGEETTLQLAGDVIVDLRPESDADFVSLIHRLPPNLNDINREAFRAISYIPWSAPAVAATQPLQDDDCWALGVVNEYGDVIGIISADDALEWIVNPSASRARRLLEREPIIQLEDGRVRVEGMTLLRVLAEQLGLSEDEVDDDAGDSRTVAGLIHDRLDRFAHVGDELTWMNRQLTVVQASDRGEVLVEIEPPEATGT